MAGGRVLPGWAVGLSMFGSYVSSISFLANPGKSFAGNWNAFVFSLATPIAALVAMRWFVPFYRRSGEVSAYEHLERRFGTWARTYAVVCFLLTQMARMGTVVYLLALAVSPLTGWDVTTIILLTGTLMIVCTLFGGIEAVVWIGVVQSLVLIVGPVICVAALLLQVPGGLMGIWNTPLGRRQIQPRQLLVAARRVDVLGRAGLRPGDQPGQLRHRSELRAALHHHPQRSRSRDKAYGSPPVSTCRWRPCSFSSAPACSCCTRRGPSWRRRRSTSPSSRTRCFPYFISHQLPLGLGGLVVAAIFAASMDSNLSSMATLTLCDLYKRYLRPQAGEAESPAACCAARRSSGDCAGTAVALAMIRSKNVLDVWWEMAGIFSGGMLGLFLLGLISRAGNAAAATGRRDRAVRHPLDDRLPLPSLARLAGPPQKPLPQPDGDRRGHAHHPAHRLADLDIHWPRSPVLGSNRRTIRLVSMNH